MSKDLVPSAASRALEELLEVSPQVDAAVILERDGGRLLASAPASSDRVADRLGATCVKIVEAAEQSRRELGREPVSQVEVATPDGHVFVVTDTTWIVAAVTDADPTVGLVFYDLKTALRTVREARSSIAGAAPKNGSSGSSGSAKKVTVVSTEDAKTSSGDEQGGGAASSSSTDSSNSDSTAGEATATSPGDDAPTAASSKSSGHNQRWRRRGKQS
jgi:predicted regulator of Ras-like GTPase activity (Roadblock/LC7/MglB family)